MTRVLAWALVLVCLASGCSGRMPGDELPDAAVPPGGDAGDPLDQDLDGDGWTRREGDCDDHRELVNPGAFDLPETGFDEDCDEESPDLDACESMLDVDSDDPADAARALGLCRFVDEASRRWGVISVKWAMPDGINTLEPNDDQRALLDHLGLLGPRAGERMLALSTGIARTGAGSANLCDRNYETRRLPPPQLDPSGRGCGERFAGAFDAIALEIKLRVPTNARALTFDSAFFTHEYPHFVCQAFNDFFVVTMEPRVSGRPDDNIVFDNEGRYVSVNSSFLGACEPGTYRGRHFECPIGVGPLRDTGFQADACLSESEQIRAAAGGSTGWLRTSASVQPGSVITLRMSIWDEGDGARDSTVLLDRFRWLPDDPGTATGPF